MSFFQQPARKKHKRREITYVKVINNLGAHGVARRRGMHDRGSISRQQTTDSNTVGREPWAIRNELSKRDRRGAFARVHAARYPGTVSPGRITRTIYDRRCGLWPAAGLSGLLSDGRRQLHGARRPYLLSENRARRFQVSGVRLTDSGQSSTAHSTLKPDA